MSHLLIHRYLNELQDLRKVSGTSRESVVREAFKDLLKGWARSHDLVFVPEYEIETPAKERRYVDGALLHTLRVPFGYWEAKDEKDDLNAEIAHKFKRGYPQDNIIFEDSSEAVLVQNRQIAMRCPVDDIKALEHLLKVFFGHERPEISDFRKAVEQFKADLPAVLESLRAMIEASLAKNATFRAAAARFLAHSREAINPSLTEADVREMLIQHVLTEEIFSKVFGEDDFHRQNNVAKALYDLEATFFTGDVKKKTLKGLGPYYAAIRAAADRISSHHEKQAFLKVIYENFYKVYNPKAADRLGVVYTPNEIVRFMVESADWLCERHFQRNLIDKDVEILDPAAGTGTFICELLEHFRGQPEKLKAKYRDELHANEVAILPYYVANLNIEATYAALTGEYAEFPNLCFVDTLDNVAALRAYRGQQDGLFGSLSEENVERIQRQNRRKISVIIGNPPYNAWQENFNLRNPNRPYKEVDDRIRKTYGAAGTAQNQIALYDMFVRFFRWASDRLDENGIIAFITNRSFVETKSFDGFRKSIQAEYDLAYIVDLGGDIRTLSGLDGIFLNEQHTIFGVSAAVGIAISFFVKKKSSGNKDCRIHYIHPCNIRATRDDKLAFLQKNPMDSIYFEIVKPDKKSNWINIPNNDFDSLMPLIGKGTKSAHNAQAEQAIFRLFSRGIATQRDEWVYDNSPDALEVKMRSFVEGYEKIRMGKGHPGDSPIKWDRELEKYRARGIKKAFDPKCIVSSLYRPFSKQSFYYDPHFNGMVYQWPYLMPSHDSPNRFILYTQPGSQKPFMVGAADTVCDLHFVGAAAATECLPFTRHDRWGNPVDNITDWALDQFRAHYESPSHPVPNGEESPFSPVGAVSGPRLNGSRGKGKTTASARPAASHPVGRDTHPGRRGSVSSPTGKTAPEPTPPITKEDIFHYVYAVLHDPLYREKYALNLKREFPRIPFYQDFWQWAAWGKELMDLHIDYETVQPFPLKRTDIPDQKARKAGLTPKPLLKADKQKGIILLDTETTLSKIPPEAWDYKLGNRSALEWVLDQHKEKKPKDPTIRQKFNTYRFADYEEKVIDLLLRVTAVSVRTVEIVKSMKPAER